MYGVVGLISKILWAAKKMITLKEYFDVVDYRITEGSDFGWDCFGENVYTLSAWNGCHDGWSACITFNTITQVVFMVEACDYGNSRAYRYFNPAYKEQYTAGGGVVNHNQAWDDINFTDLELSEDWLEKARAIVLGKTYDTRIKIPVDLTDKELLHLFKSAHENDLTLNQYVNNLLLAEITLHKQ